MTSEEQPEHLWEAIFHIGLDVDVKVTECREGILVRLMTMNAGDMIVVPMSGNSVIITSEKTYGRQETTGC
jgi:hypothetical protein